MKLLAFIEAPDHVCYRYRIEAFSHALSARGWTLEAMSLAPGTLRRSGQLKAARQADVTILQRRLLPLWQVRLLRKYAQALIYDIDDALFYRDSFSKKGPESWTRLAHFWATIYAADAVFAGNAFLRDQAALYVDPERVHLVPTCVDLARYEPAVHRRRGAGVRLVWIGQQSTLLCLEHAAAQLAAASERTLGTELRVISDRFLELPGVRTVPMAWSSATEALDLAECDIGVSWLPDDPWSLGKCGLKVLQYMAAGLPVVANPVGMNREMVVDGITGFIAQTPREWAVAVARLAADPGLRQRMGRAGRELALRRFSTQTWATEFANRVDQVFREKTWSALPSGGRRPQLTGGWAGREESPQRPAAARDEFSDERAMSASIERHAPWPDSALSRQGLGS